MAKEEAWDIVMSVTKRVRVVFERPVTRSEAKKLFLSEKYYDIVDEEEISIDEVIEIT